LGVTCVCGNVYLWGYVCMCICPLLHLDSPEQFPDCSSPPGFVQTADSKSRCLVTISGEEKGCLNSKCVSNPTRSSFAQHMRNLVTPRIEILPCLLSNHQCLVWDLICKKFNLVVEGMNQSINQPTYPPNFEENVHIVRWIQL
jgi:hypothetical protein